MRIKFIGNSYLKEYHRPGKEELHFRQGEAKEVSKETIDALLRDFPGLFVTDIKAPIVDRQLKEPEERK